MTTKRLKIILLASIYLIGIFMSTQIMAVDGYKNLKFGMTKKQVIESNICTFGDVDSATNIYETIPCFDFKFGNDTVVAVALFIDGKFLRFAFFPPFDSWVGLITVLKDKYGNPV